MTFIFTPERDPRREQVADHKVGSKVKYRGMTMPAEVLSGPHTSPGNDRYLIRKADGNVSLVPVTDLERVVPRVDQVAGTLSVVIYGRAFVNLDLRTQIRVANVAKNVLDIADRTRGEV
ncbi:hypothetical protein OG548_08160 [Streptomyces sp. NBC_01356]|uniref:hypothetical protein n=1 Tax=Streptomyces sp. NBC_01356 TaxID=2903836 RepID=UPI002E3580D5|nr:hypothetical protein [Streptomyces sp. NBC_01356]